MTDKALISDLTWRSHSMQVKAFEGTGLSIYSIEDDLEQLFRSTTRKEILNIRVVSLGVIAASKNAVMEFAALCKKRKAHLCDKTGLVLWAYREPVSKLIRAWQDERRNGAAKAGGLAKANKDERIFWEGFSRIADRWHLPAKKENASPALLDEADTSRNTVRSYLGYTREEWQRLTQAKRERILKGKINVEV